MFILADNKSYLVISPIPLSYIAKDRFLPNMNFY